MWEFAFSAIPLIRTGLIALLAALECEQMFQAIYCLNGHLVGDANDSFDTVRLLAKLPEREQAYERMNSYCAICSQPTISSCKNCIAPILVEDHTPSFCRFCGKAFPWTETALNAAREYTDEIDGLTGEDRAKLKATFDDLTADTPRTELAAHRFMKFIRKAGPAAGDVLTKIMVNVATEGAKKMMGI